LLANDHLVSALTTTMSAASSELASDKDKHTQATQDLEKGVVPDAEGGEAEEAKPAPAAEKAPQAPGAPGFFSWALPALQNPRMLKTCVRCVLASAAAIVLLVDKATLATMG
jgi:hypothetical protein